MFSTAPSLESEVMYIFPMNVSFPKNPRSISIPSKLNVLGSSLTSVTRPISFPFKAITFFPLIS